MATEKKVSAQTGGNKLQLGEKKAGPVAEASRASKAGKPYSGSPGHSLPR